MPVRAGHIVWPPLPRVWLVIWRRIIIRACRGIGSRGSCGADRRAGCSTSRSGAPSRIAGGHDGAAIMVAAVIATAVMVAVGAVGAAVVAGGAVSAAVISAGAIGPAMIGGGAGRAVVDAGRAK